MSAPVSLVLCVVIGHDVQSVLIKTSSALRHYFPRWGFCIHSWKFQTNGVVLLPTDIVRKDKKKDERVDHILDMI
ncbi:hypothetical protein DY000_02031751 [Brassica cretica]|uniref:SNRNP25 ubiquitin-like domain-containing protein n=1 Tax=Brassica cretica TaxID=69181 RepID=A0ABQ7DSV2_BRACR|nr:hypothetical protein DY000_02031751 [Brassica cretica]